MKLNTNINRSAKKQRTGGFTLLEMIGVLAVIAILAAVLIPKVFAAIDNARVSNAAISCNTVKTAIVDHYSKFGSLVEGINVQSPMDLPLGWQYDTNLITESYLDKPFATKIGDGTTNTTIEVSACCPTNIVVTAPASPDYTAAAGAGQVAFSLDGSGVNRATGGDVVYAVITGVNINDARALNLLIDGSSSTLGEGATAGQDLAGRVKYNFGGNLATPTTVYVYLTHR